MPKEEKKRYGEFLQSERKRFHCQNRGTCGADHIYGDGIYPDGKCRYVCRTGHRVLQCDLYCHGDLRCDRYDPDRRTCQSAAGAGFRYGPECIFCLYRMFRFRPDLCQCAGAGADGRYYLYYPDCDRAQGKDFRGDSESGKSGNSGGYRPVYCFYWSAECGYHCE